MHTLDDAVRLQELPHAIPRTADHRAVITRTKAHILTARKSARERGDHCIFAKRRDFHGVSPARVCHHISASMIELKHACMKIGTRIEPDHS